MPRIGRHRVDNTPPSTLPKTKLSRYRYRRFACSLYLMASLMPSVGLAELPPRLSFEYSPPNNRRCPTYARVKKRLVTCLIPAPVYLHERITASIELTDRSPTLDAFIYLRNASGGLAGIRRIEGRKRGCTSVVSDAVLALCLSLEQDTSTLFQQRRTAEPVTASRRRRPTIPHYALPFRPSPPATDTSSNALSSASTDQRVSGTVHAGTTAFLGMGFKPSLGPSFSLEIGQSEWHLGSGADWTGRTSHALEATGSVTIDTWRAHLYGCWRMQPEATPGTVTLCGKVLAGMMRAVPTGLNASRTINELVLGVGPRIGFEMKFSSSLYLGFGLDLLGRLVAPKISVESTSGTAVTIFEPWPFSVSFDLSLGVRLF